MSPLPRLQTQLGPPDYDDREEDGCGEAGCEFVVASGDASPVFEAAKHAFDEIALAIGVLVERVKPFARWIVRNERGRAELDEEMAQTIAVIGGVACQATPRREGADQSRGNPDIAELAGRYFNRDRAPAGVNDGVDFRRAASSRAANRLRLSPPFPPAAER